MTVYHRTYKNSEDYKTIRNFLENSLCVSGPKFYFFTGDLDFALGLNSTENFLENIDEIFEDLILWFDDSYNELLGATWLRNQRVDIFYNPNNDFILDEMVDVAENQRICKRSAYDSNCEIEWWVFDDHIKLQNILRSKGYQKSNSYRPHFSLDYSKSMGQTLLPEGYIVKNAGEIKNKSGILNIYKECFKGFGMSEYMLNNLEKTITYRNDLDLVIVDSDDTIVSFCSLRYDKKNKIGGFEPVACHPLYRRKGLTSAIMQEAIIRAKKYNAELITVHTGGTTIPAIRLYESLGFRMVGKNYVWKKTL